MIDFAEMSGIFSWAPKSIGAMGLFKKLIGKMSNLSRDTKDLIEIAKLFDKALGFAGKGVSVGKSVHNLEEDAELKKLGEEDPTPPATGKFVMEGGATIEYNSRDSADDRDSYEQRGMKVVKTEPLKK